MSTDQRLTQQLAALEREKGALSEASEGLARELAEVSSELGQMRRSARSLEDNLQAASEREEHLAASLTLAQQEAATEAASVEEASP